MSELKARGVDDVYLEYFNTGKHELSQVYLKSEADKAIEDIVKAAISMFRESKCCRGLDTKSPIGQIANAAYKHWLHVDLTHEKNKRLEELNDSLRCDNRKLRNSIIQLREAAEKRERRLKYKRCVELADSCALRTVVAKMENRRFPTPKNSWRMFIYPKWHKRWLAIAEKFKEAK